MAFEQPSAEFLAESQGPTVKAVMWLMSGLPIIFVVLRLYVRLYLKRVFGWDDLIAVVAVGCLLGYAAVCHTAADVGLGRHIQWVSLNPNNLIAVARLSSISQALAIIACALGKTSFAVTLLRIVVVSWMKYLLWFIIITMNIVNILAALFVFVQCKDPQSNWDPSVVSECWPTDVFTNFSLFVGAYSGTQDFVLTLLPWTIVWNLQMKKEEKVGVAFAMSLGIFPITQLGCRGGGLTIIASSILTLKPLLTKLYPPTNANASYNMLPPRAQHERRKSNSICPSTRRNYATQAGLDDSSQQSILPTTNTNKINMTTEVSVSYKFNEGPN